MNTLLLIFTIALVTSLTLTPLVRDFALRRHILKEPNHRDTHTIAKPRLGGVAMFTAFLAALGAGLLVQTNISLLIQDFRFAALFFGAGLMFLTGLIDDLYHLKSTTKLGMQIFAALITWYGGIQINVVSTTLTSGTELGWLSLPVTVFWIVLVTNAINLIDGLDGLAAGVTLFVSMMMLVLCIISHNYIIAIGFAALAGSTLGFLRYNFNPASIFMGDSGSYFLGYSIATLSILGSVKGQATFAMLVPFLALGVPIFDTLLSPLRRFIRGKKLFTPDQSHLHHKLMENGESHRRTVLILYSITIVLSGAALSLIYVRDDRAALILLIPAIILFFLFRKIGYLNYFAIDKMYGWLRDITDSSRISRDSRTFLDHQMEISKAKTIDEMWEAATRACAFLELDEALLALAPGLSRERQHVHSYRWHREYREGEAATHDAGYQFKIEYPLINRREKTEFLGRLIIHKYTLASPVKQFTIRRIEQLQRELIGKIHELHQQQLISHAPQKTSPHPHILKN